MDEAGVRCCFRIKITVHSRGAFILAEEDTLAEPYMAEKNSKNEENLQQKMTWYGILKIWPGREADFANW